MPLQWMRRWIRRSTKPIPVTKAEMWKRRLSIAYAFFAWNAIAIVGYSFYKGKGDWAAYHGLPVDKASPGKC